MSAKGWANDLAALEAVVELYRAADDLESRGCLLAAQIVRERAYAKCREMLGLEPLEVRPQ